MRFHEEPETTVGPTNKVILVLVEPPCVHHPNIPRGEYAPIGPFVLRTYDELASMEPPRRTKCLSIVCSDKTYSAGNRKRLEFCRRVKEHFGSEVDFFG